MGATAPDIHLRGVMDTGMTRKIDDLGRIVIPAETRRLFKIREGDYLTISVQGDSIVIRKLRPISPPTPKNTTFINFMNG